MDIDVANNVKAIELLKVEILQNIASMFGNIISEPSDDIGEIISDNAANIISLTYLLCKRLGIGQKIVNEKMKIKLQKSIENNHNLEKRFGDLGELLAKLELDS